MDTIADYERWKVLAGKTIPAGDTETSAKELATMYAIVTGHAEPSVSMVLMEPEIFRKAIADRQAASKEPSMLTKWLATHPLATPAAPSNSLVAMTGLVILAIIATVVVVATYRNRRKFETALVSILVVFFRISRSIFRFGQRVIRQAREGMDEQP